MKLIRAFSVVALCLALTGCGKYNFREIYRYPCQDPANWETAECQAPVCEASGTCTKDILKGTPLNEENQSNTSTETTNE